TVIHAHERGTPEGREPIRWNLLTDLPVGDLAATVEKLNWYALRWKLETYHKVLKSGCQAEQARLRTAERLTNLWAVLCVVGWRGRGRLGGEEGERAAPRRPRRERFDEARDRTAGSPGGACDADRRAAGPAADDQPLPGADRETGRLPGPCARSASRQPGALA